jgi:hypothetical protein
MKIEISYPPNYEEIKKHFPELEDFRPLFCYGDIIYNPFGYEVTKDLIIHENVHSKQQGRDVKGWYDKYFNDPKFRIDQEIPAYGEQFRYIKNNFNYKLQKKFLDHICFSLSGEFYGNMVSFQEAEQKIRNYIKQ